MYIQVTDIFKDKNIKMNGLNFAVGFTIAEYNFLSALVAAIIIAIVTFIICMIGLFLGKKFGTKLSGKAQILGGVILIGIGLEILISSFLK